MAVYDFSGAFQNLNNSISGLGQTFQDQRKRQTLSDIGSALQRGDHAGAQALAFQAGELNAGLKLTEMAQSRSDTDAFNKGLNGLLGGGQSGGASPGSINNLGSGAPAAQGGMPVANGSPLANIGTPGQVETRFMGAAREAGLNNPFGLAALAATGQRESRFSPQNANRTWSDPSQSGQAGTSGGILSWRNERLRGLHSFAQQRGEQVGSISPETQALYAFSEDPTLIHRLNAAKSDAEANDVMARAWRFAGYDNQNSAEYQARLGATRQYVARYNGGQGGGGQQPTQVAQTGATEAGRAQMAVARVDSLLNDPELSPEQRQSLQQRRERYVQMAQPAQPSQPQADMPAAGSMPAQQDFVIPGTGQVVPAGTQLTPRAINMMRMLAANVPEHRKEPVRQLLKLELEAANPATLLANRKAQLDIQKAERDLDGTGRIERGLTPQFGVDANGNPVMLQIGKDGTAVQTQMPDGVSLSKEPLRIDAGTHTVLLDPVTRQQIGLIPKNLGAAEAEKVTGKAQGEAMTALPKAIGQAQGMLDTIKKVREHPGRDSFGATGASSTWPIVGQGIPNTQGRDFVGLVNQMQGQAFLAAFESLKGGGVITDIEGKKATDAIARLDRAQTKAGFDAALKDLEDVAQAGINRAMKQARSGGPAPQAVGQPQQGASSVAAPSVAIQALRANPSLAADFDAKYGQGMAAQILR